MKSTTPGVKGDIIIDANTLQILILKSFRYCLGRKSMAVSECVEIIIEYWEVLSSAFKLIIYKEIQEAIDRGEAGMQEDIKEWDRILNLYNVQERLLPFFERNFGTKNDFLNGPIY